MQSKEVNGTPLEKYLYDLVRSKIQKDSTSKDRAKAIHVTSLTAPCVRRTYYDISRPKKEIAYESAAIFRIGQIVHEGVVLNEKHNEVPLSANIRTMTKIPREEINPINFFDCVTGTVDDLVDYGPDTVIVDKKTYSTLKRWEPTEASEDYVFQLNEYKLLYYINYGKEIKKGAIIYLDTASRFDKIRVFEVQLEPIEIIKAKVLAKLDMLKSGVIPPRVISWRCLYCNWNGTDVCNPKSDPNYETLVKNK